MWETLIGSSRAVSRSYPVGAGELGIEKSPDKEAVEVQMQVWPELP